MQLQVGEGNDHWESKPADGVVVDDHGRAELLELAPRDEPKSMSQASPRLGAGTVAVQILLAECLEGGQGGISTQVRFEHLKGIENRLVVARTNSCIAGTA